MGLIFYRSGLTLREEYVLSYADHLLSDHALWRITIAYMCSCGEIGMRRADEVLLRVPLDTDRASSDDMGEVPEVLKEVVQTCFDYGREHIRRQVCSVSVTAFRPLVDVDIV